MSALLAERHDDLLPHIQHDLGCDLHALADRTVVDDGGGSERDFVFSSLHNSEPLEAIGIYEQSWFSKIYKLYGISYT